MRVLHYPFNLASQMAVTVRAERRLGLDAVGIARKVKDQFRTDSEGIDLYPSRFKFILRWLKEFWRADVLHCYAGGKVFPLRLELLLCLFSRKRKIVEWMGGEIRMPSVESRLNPFYAQTLKEGYEYPESDIGSILIQTAYRLAGFRAVINAVSLADYMITPFDRVERRIDVPEKCPKSRKMPKKPRVLHAPSAPICKGTKYVDAEMKKVGWEYIKLIGADREKVQEEIKKADIVIDQLMLGEFGLVTIEALAQGKPVLCYVRREVCWGYPRPLPLVLAHADSVIFPLLIAKFAREPKDCWQFARTHFHSDVVAQRLKEIYEAPTIPKVPQNPQEAQVLWEEFYLRP